MVQICPPQEIRICENISDEIFHNEIRTAHQPVILRGLVADWPAVHAAKMGDEAMAAYLNECGTTQPITALAAPPSAKGRFYYNDEMTGFNFITAKGNMAQFLQELLQENKKDEGFAMAVQSEILRIISPPFAMQNRLDLLPDVDARIWIGNKVRVATHFDLSENVACNVAGRRKFTLFPPDQLANLYLGPMELTPAGTPVSMVDPQHPDLGKYPRFAKAWEHVQTSILEAGDALYIPYGWWHAVDSLDSLNILVNYWWNNPHIKMASPYDALLHMIAAYRHLPDHQKQIWQNITNNYVFSKNDVAAHLPEQSKGMLANYSPLLIENMINHLKRSIA
ncbi:hypothetical protein LPB140_05355 [Sphingorhabdus lutea]|uniref:JmjC domain-containing protein n=1 Tax=Sphingorhabdus lutea TaxID=1913578 RepID=A0A1L3JB18_9SPHN|nr:cupin-like domain-containing protein [Sphingorhabdus lutea]APG62321.1 hypothetical protein LPB140_05355 [Sphingorhabdus lutea]